MKERKKKKMTARNKKQETVTLSTILEPLFKNKASLDELKTEVFKASVSGTIPEISFSNVENEVLKTGSDLGYILSPEKVTEITKNWIDENKDNLPLSYQGVLNIASELSEQYYNPESQFFDALKTNWKGNFPKKTHEGFKPDSLIKQSIEALLKNPEFDREAFKKHLRENLRNIKKDCDPEPISKIQADKYYNNAVSIVLEMKSFLDVLGAEGIKNLLK